MMTTCIAVVAATAILAVAVLGTILCRGRTRPSVFERAAARLADGRYSEDDADADADADADQCPACGAIDSMTIFVRVDPWSVSDDPEITGCDHCVTIREEA
jgi:hypothetical protein